MANKNSIKFVVDENVAAVLDDFYKWAKVFLKFFLKQFQGYKPLNYRLNLTQRQRQTS